MTEALFFPVLAQVALTFGLLFNAAGQRYRCVASGAVKAADIVLGQKVWPKGVQQASNAFQNQMETPVLDATGPILVMLAWTWFGLRVVHAGIHITSNNLRLRFLAFAAGTLTLLSFWVVLLVEVLSR